MNIPFENELKLPAVAAPMFLISGPQLVIECCKNGIVGTFPALNHRTTEGFEEWVVEIKEALDSVEKETGDKAEWTEIVPDIFRFFLSISSCSFCFS